jgi:hypothetical protein
MSVATFEPTLFPIFRRHLEQEEACLTGTLTALRQTRAALLGRDPAALAAAIEEQEKQIQFTTELHARRKHFRNFVAEHLHIRADDVSLSKLMPHFPPAESTALADDQTRLRRLADEVQQLNQSNAGLIWHCLDFLNSVFAGLTGQEGLGGRYSRAGQHEAARFSALLEVQG